MNDHVARCDHCRQLVAVIAGSRTGSPTPLEVPRRIARGTAEPLGPGSKVDRYRIESLLGQGGMGVVYAAHDPELDRRVAVKLIRPELSASGSVEARLVREARAMARLTHPNVIAVHDVGTDDGQVFVAMELVDGTTLRGWLAAAPRTWREVVAAFAAAGEGLAAAHAAGLVHRDFKPDNVLVDRGGRVRVTDFGLARSSEEPASASAEATPSGELLPLTVTGTVMGTPAYMAPEQYRHDPATARSDQFSFCVALYQALWQTRPFAGDDAAHLADEVLAGRLRQPPRSEVPAAVRRAIVRGLALDPADRFSSMRALLDALTPGRRRRAIAMVALGVVLGAGAITAAAAAQPARTALTMCGGGQARMDGVWSATRRAAVRHNLLAAGTPQADATWQLVARTLDGYARGWVAMYTDTCMASERGEQSADLLDLRMRCLDGRLDDLRLTTGMLASPDPMVSAYALGSAEGVKATEGCGAAVVLEAHVPEPADPTTKAAVDRMRDQLSRAEALRLAGRFAEAGTLLGSLAERAAASGFQPVVAEVQYYQGVLAAEQGGPEAAVKLLKDAAHTAEAARHDEVAADAWIQLIMIESQDLADYPRALEDGENARAAIDRLGGAEILLAEYHHHMGATYWAMTRPDQARAEFEASLALWRKLGDATSALLPLEGTGLVAQDQGHLGEARAIYQQVLDARLAALGPDHPDTALSHTNLASVLLELGDGKAALDHAEKAYAIDRQVYGEAHLETLKARYNVGESLRELGRTDEAMAAVDDAVTRFRAAEGDESLELATALEERSGLEDDLGRPREAVAAARAALAMFEKLAGPDAMETARCRINLAEALRGVGQHHEALALDRAAQVAITALLGGDNVDIAHPLLGIGEAELATGHAREALPSFERALELFLAAEVDPAERARAELDVARAHWALGEKDDALELVGMARDDLAGRAAPRTERELASFLAQLHPPR